MAGKDVSANPLTAAWGGAFGLPPFAAVKPEQFRSAFDAALSAHRAEIDAIAGDPAAPGFANTVEALERSGALLDQVSNLFFVLAGADTADAIQAVEREMSPLLARHWNALYLNAALFRRIDALYRARDSLGLTAEQKRVLERYHTRFAARRGAGADKAAKDRLAAIIERLASARHRVRPERAGRRAVLRAAFWSEADLAGLPDFARAQARKPPPRARPSRASTPSRWRAPASSRSCNSRRGAICARRRSAPGSRAATTAAQTDNKAIIAEIVALRAERARLLGYPTFAHYRLDDAMAKTPASAARAARQGLGAAPGRARDRARRLAGAGDAGGRQLQARALGLALLRREAAQGALRLRRGRDQAVPPARQHDRGGVLRRRRGCSA